jgi:hypothetical protein
MLGLHSVRHKKKSQHNGKPKEVRVRDSRVGRARGDGSHVMSGLHRKEINVSSAIFPQHLPPPTSRSHLFISCFRTEFNAAGDFLWSCWVHNNCRTKGGVLGVGGGALLGKSDVIKRLKEVLQEMILVI